MPDQELAELEKTMRFTRLNLRKPAHDLRESAQQQQTVSPGHAEPWRVGSWEFWQQLVAP